LHSLLVALSLIMMGGCARRQAGEERLELPSIEVVHWLTSPEESAALAAARRSFTAQGGVWRETALPGVAVTQSTVINRTIGGQPPAVFQVSVGARLAKLGQRGLVGIAPVDTAELDARLPPLIAAAAKRDGRYIAVPAYIRGENWMFFNKPLLARFRLSPPKTWSQFLRAAKVIQAGGVTPIALGGEPWQERILFNSVLLGVGGRDFYRRVYLLHDSAALTSHTMLQVFETFAALRAYVDKGSPGRPWPQAAAMVLRGDAAFQFMGDWAKSSFRGKGGAPDSQIGCALAPAREAAYIVAVDAFGFAESHDPATRAGQRLFAQVILAPAVQRSMSLTLGSIPVSRAVSPAGFDPCAQIAMATIAENSSLLPSTGLFALSAPLSGALDDTIGMFWHNPAMSPAEGQNAFAQTMSLYGASGG
jgi:glucose/mannose transport system substrate-binding protein